MLDFPSAPSTGQKYPASVIAGIPQYTWDGEKWTTVGAGSATSAPPAAALPLMDATPAVVGVTTKYAREDHVHPTDTSMLQKSANLSDVANIVTARQSIYAAPFDAMAYSGMQINGSMEVSQENGTTAVSVTGAKNIVDGWKVWTGGAQTVLGFQDTSNFPAGFLSSLQVSVTVANASPGSSDFCGITQNFEGYRVQRLGFGTASASPITFGFWVLSSRTGQHSGSVFESGGSRSCPFIFIVNATTGFEYKTVTIPGDVAGTWSKGNLGSLSVLFSLMAGGGVTGTAGVWAAGLQRGVAGSVNCVATTSDHLLITGVVVLPGIEAPSAARSPLIMRPYDQELLTCQRYYEKSYSMPTAAGTAVGAGNNGFILYNTPNNASFGFLVPYKVRKRAAPTLAIYDGAGSRGYCSFYNGGGWNNGGSWTNISPSAVEYGINLMLTGSGACLYFGVDFTADARL